MKIPRLMHQIWLGRRPLHPLMQLWRRRLEDLHPRWTLATWSEIEDRVLGSSTGLVLVPDDTCKDLLQRSCHLAQMTNIWRYLILREHGGLYLDTDVEPLRPFDDLIDDLSAFAGRRQGVPEIMCETAFMGAVPRHPWTADLVRELPTRDPAQNLSMGCDYLTLVTRRHPEVVLLPEEEIVFLPPDDWVRAHREARVPEPGDPRPTGARAVHHWASLWHKRGFERLDRSQETPA